MRAQRRKLMTDQRTAVERADRDEADLPVGELKNLKGARELEQLHDVVGNDLFRADRAVDREILAGEYLGMRQVVGRANACDLVRDVEHGRRELAGNHVGFVALGYREDEIRVARPRLLQDGGMRGIAGDGAQVKPVLQALQPLEVDIDDGDVVRF